MSTVWHTGHRINVSFEVKLPADASDVDITEWLRFNLHEHGSMKLANALIAHEIEARFVGWYPRS